MDNSQKKSLQDGIAELINKHSLENETNTPDFILAQYLTSCLEAYNNAVRDRASWYGRIDAAGVYSI